jgi:hypothetical protein
MHTSDERPASGQDETPRAPSSLFRQEALDNQEQKLHGDILLIRPFSLAFLAWLGTGLTALAVAVLIWGEYTDQARVAGVVKASSGRVEASMDVPGRLVAHLHAGTQVPVICSSCPRGYRGTVRGISSVAPGAADTTANCAPAHEPVYRVVVTLDSQSGPALSDGSRIEADLPLDRRPLLRWIFSRPAA